MAYTIYRGRYIFEETEDFWHYSSAIGMVLK
jgi:hypothetical protein